MFLSSLNCTKTNSDSRCQFHQHFTHAFLYKSKVCSFTLITNWLCDERISCGERISEKKAHIKCWWNWLQKVICNYLQCSSLFIVTKQITSWNNQINGHKKHSTLQQTFPSKESSNKKPKLVEVMFELVGIYVAIFTFCKCPLKPFLERC